jgi:MFS family permease
MATVATGSDAVSNPDSAPHAGHQLAVPDFEIVPRAGLALAGVILVAVVVAIASDKLWPLEFMHVVFGSGWTVVDLFVGFVIGPILGRLSVPARIEFTVKFMPKMVVLLPPMVAATLAAGWQLSTKLGTNLSSYHQHGWVVASFIVVGVMAVFALGLLEPANIAVLIELKKPRPNPAVIERLMKRFVYVAGVTGAMQIATFVIMTKLASS